MVTPAQSAALRVGHAIVRPDTRLEALGGKLSGSSWDMVELDVLRADDGELVVAHDSSDLALATRVAFDEALAALVAAVGPTVRFDIDVKATGYEHAVADAIASAGIGDRTLVSTMHVQSLRALRAHAPTLRLGLSVPLARRDYLASRLSRPGAYAMLAYLRRVLPQRVARTLDTGEADAIMAHWGVVTERLVEAVRDRGGELFVWTVDDPARLPRLLSLGVSGIITNHADVFAATDG